MVVLAYSLPFVALPFVAIRCTVLFSWLVVLWMASVLFRCFELGSWLPNLLTHACFVLFPCCFFDSLILRFGCFFTNHATLSTLSQSNSFPVVGAPHTLRWMQQPPANVVTGTPFNATVEVLDQHGHRVFEYDDAHSALLPLVALSISNWNDPR